MDVIYDSGTGEEGRELKRDLPSFSSLSKEELYKLFDEKYGILDGGVILTHEEYIKHREWSVESGLFSFQVEKYHWGNATSV